MHNLYLFLKKVNAIIQFVGERLSDSVLVPRCIDIYLVLVNTDIISSTDVIQICNAYVYLTEAKKNSLFLLLTSSCSLFSNIKVKKLPQQSRFKILSILGKALEKYSSGKYQEEMTLINQL